MSNNGASLRVLVLDAETRPALAAIRSLGKSGHAVVSAGRYRDSLAFASKFSAASGVYPDPYADSGAFLSSVVEMTRQHAIDVLLPITEITTLLVTANRKSFPPGLVIPFGEHEVVAAAADKSEVLTTAASLGIPIPRTVILRNPLEPVDSQKITFPCVVKPARSRVHTPQGWISGGVSYPGNPSALADIIAATHPANFPLLIQERIVGPGVGVFAFCDRGHALAWFAHRRIREKPPSGGVSVLCESVLPDPQAKAYAKTLLRAIGWHGVAMVEFKINERDGSLRLMEINGRLWGSLQLAIEAGVDFPSMLVAQAAGLPISPVDEYQVGVRCRWFWGDVDHLLAILGRSRNNLSLPPDFPGRARTLLKFIATSFSCARNEVWQGGDPGPGRVETLQWFKGILRL